MLLILGIVVAAIIIASAIIHKDQLPLNSSVNKTILSKKIAYSVFAVFSNAKKAASSRSIQ
jgi:hypothetical protein